MGQKVNPKGIRIGITRDWDSKWFASKKEYSKLFHQDLAIEKMLKKSLERDGLSHIEIMRTQGKVLINIYTAKPGMIIGRGGEIIEKIKDSLHKEFKETFAINIKEVKKPMLDAQIVADIIARQMEKRVSFRRAAKANLDKIMESGAMGAKIYLGGRLNGVEIARGEFFTKGKVPLHTFRADIDYACETAFTSFGTIGVKVWIYRGEVFKKDLAVKRLQELEEIKQS